MRFLISTTLGGNVEDFSKSLKRYGIKNIELHHRNSKQKDVEKLKKLNIISIKGSAKDYKYLLFLAQSIGCEYIYFSFNKGELKKLRPILSEAEKLGVAVAIENNDYIGRTASEMYTVLSSFENLKFVFNTANAKKYNRNIVGYVKMLKKSIVGVNISDYYKGLGNLPYSLGEFRYLDETLFELKDEKLPFLVDLNEGYGIDDFFISIEKINQRVKNLKIENARIK